MIGQFEKFCVVGLGGHAKTKLIPALLDNGQEIAGFVSSQDTSGLSSAPCFSRLEDALAGLPPGTVFVVATPPAVHFHHSRPVLLAGRDLILEKPAFINAAESREAAAMAAHAGCVLVEAFMHRHTRLHGRLLAFWATERERITGLRIDFVIPEIPDGTFRQGANVGSSALYDIGCYPLSLLADLGLPLDGLDISGFDFPGRPNKEAVQLAGRLDGIAVESTVGVGPAYANIVVVTLDNGLETRFTPFFFGRAADRSISRGSDVETLYDENAYQKMFAIPRAEWLANQPGRMASMVQVTSQLEALGAQLVAQRRKRLGSAQIPPRTT